MYELDDRTTLTNGRFPVAGFAKVRDVLFSDTATAYLSHDNLDRATMTVLRSAIPMLDRSDREEFFRLWGEENDFCPIYNFFFYIDTECGEYYLILEINDMTDRLTLWDFPINLGMNSIENYLMQYGDKDSRAKWENAKVRAAQEEQEREEEENEEE